MSLAASTKAGWVSDVVETSVKSTTLDNYKIAKGTGNIDIFTESKGMKDYFNYSQYKEIESLIQSCGYYPYLITDKALFGVDTLEFNGLERNYIFSKKNQNIDLYLLKRLK